MKATKLVFKLISIVFVISGCGKDSEKFTCDFTDFYYYQGDPNIIGEMSGEYIVVGSDSSNTDISIRAFIESSNYFDQNFIMKIEKSSNYRYKQIALKFKKNSDCKIISNAIYDIEKNEVIDYAHFGINTDYCRDSYGYSIGEKCIYSYSSLFYVKVKDSNNLADLEISIAETNTILIEQDNFMDDWFTIEANKNSQGDAMQMANYFYETGFFEACEPDILLIPVE